MSIEIVFWIIWLLSIFSLIAVALILRMPIMVLFVLVIVLTGINMYLYQSEKRKIKKIKEDLEKLNLRPLEKKIRNIREEQTDYLTRNFKLELELNEQKKELNELQQKLEKIPKDQEIKYREIARKVLDLDNRINEKFKLLGEAILKISEEKR